MSKPVIHITDVQTFVQCRYRWYYSSPLQNNLEPVRPNKHLLLGTAVHAALAAYYDPSVPRSADVLISAYEEHTAEALVALEREIIEVPEDVIEAYSLGRVMLDHYAVWAPHHDDFEVLLTEYTLEHDWGDFTFQGTADAVVRRGDDLWIVEHKTYTHVPSGTALGFSMQPPAYIHAARRDPEIVKHGNVVGVLYNILRKYPPASPGVLKSGKLSRRANIACSPYWFAHCVREAGQDVSEYADFIDTLDPFKLNYRAYITVSDQRMRVFEDYLRVLADEMLNEHNVRLYPANPIYNCDNCGYQSLCAQALYGEPWEPLVGLEYRDRSTGGEDDKHD